MSATTLTDLRDTLACFHMLRRYLLRGDGFGGARMGKKS